jgi:predicted nucleic acid-binding protein
MIPFRYAMLDTGVVVKHASLIYSPKKAIKKHKIGNGEKDFLLNLFKEVSVYTTPQVLCESWHLLPREVGIKEKAITDFITGKYKRYIVDRMREKYIVKDKILICEALKFGVTDASLVLAAKNLTSEMKRSVPLITYDSGLVGWCSKKRIFCCHVHELISLNVT